MPVTTPQRPAAAASAATAAELRQKPTTTPSSPISARFAALKKHVLSADPYIITLDSGHPYRSNSYECGTYLSRGTPFDWRESHLQYSTFLLEPWREEGLMVHGGCLDENGSLLPEDPYKSSSRSTTTTPHINATKKGKKLTLSEYNSRKTAKKSEEPTNPLPTQENQNEQEMPKSAEASVGKRKHEETNIAKPISPTHVETSKTTVNRSNKRPLETEVSHVTPVQTVKPEEHQLFKKPRLNSEPIQTLAAEKKHKDKETRHGLPPELSPTIAISDHISFPNLDTIKTIPHGLPPLLSPTLTPSIDKWVSEAEQRKKNHDTAKRTVSTESKASTDSSASINIGVDSSFARKLAKNAIYSSNDAQLSNKISKTKTTGSETRRHSVEAHTPKSFPSQSQAVDLALMIKLRYGKTKRKTVQRILGMQPRPRLVVSPTSKGISTPTLQSESLAPKPSRARESRSQADAQNTSTLSNTEKRTRHEERDSSSEPLAKRQKVAKLHSLPAKRSATPSDTSFKSPAPRNLSQKLYETPKKETKNIALKHVGSVESVARTPLGNSVPATPAIPGSAERKKTAAPSAVSFGEWYSKYEKYMALGKELKHKTDALGRKVGSHSTETDKKLIAATAFEAIICWCLSFSILDHSYRLRGKILDANSWRSIFPFFEQTVEPNVRRYPALHGFSLQLAARIRNLIHQDDLTRLANDQLPVAAAEEALPPTPGNEGDLAAAKVAERNAQYRKEYLVFRQTLISNARKADLLWRDGLAELSLADLMKKFPRTWNSCSKRPLEWTGKDKIVLEKGFGGPFTLPLSSNSSPFELSRAGLALLGEWCKQEGVKWKGLLEL